MCVCVCALNEMNACAPPLPNYREWRREISGRKEKDVMQAGIEEKNDVQRLERSGSKRGIRKNGEKKIDKVSPLANKLFSLSISLHLS